MRKILQTTYFRMVFLCLTALAAAILIKCGQVYDNPVSPNYNGDYKFGIVWNWMNDDTSEVLKNYTIVVNDSGKDKYYHFRVTTDPVTKLKFEDSRSASNLFTLKLMFKQAFKGKLSIIGIRPNLTEDTYDTNIIINNHYIITGDSIVGSNVDAKLRVSRSDQNSIDTTLSVIWDTTFKTFSRESIQNPISLSYNGRDTVKISAILVSKQNDSCLLDPFTVVFKGKAPVIKSVSKLDTLRLGVPPKFRVVFSNENSGDVFFNVFDVKHNKLLTSVPYLATGDTAITVMCDVNISDTETTSIGIVATNSEGLSSVPYIIEGLNILYTKPVVHFLTNEDTVFFRLGQMPTFIATGEADSFKWVIDNGSFSLFTKENTLTLDTLKDLMPHNIILTGFRLGLQSKPDTLRYRGKEVKYTIDTLRFPSVVKTGTWHSWEVRTVDNQGMLINNDSVQYVWQFPEGIRDSTSMDKSKLYLYFDLDDSIPVFKLEVYAIIGNKPSIGDTTVSYIGQVKTKVFRPECKFKTDCDTIVKLMDSVMYYVDTYDTDPEGSVDTVYYYVKSPLGELEVKKGVKEPWGYKFKNTGKHVLATWAKNTLGYESAKDTLIVNATTDKPVFKKSLIDTFTYATDSFTLNAFTETNPDSIKNYFWDLGDNNSYDTVTESSSLQLQFNDTGSVTIKVNCISILDDSAALPLIFKVNVRSGDPVINSVFHSTPVYYNDSCTFVINAKDFGNNGRIDNYLVSVDSARSFSPMNNDTFKMAFSNKGKKILYFKVVDNMGLYSTDYRDSIFVDPGAPVIEKVSIKHSGKDLYVKNDFSLYFTARDPNGSVKKIFVSWNGDTISDDTILIKEKVQNYSDSFQYVFDTSSYGSRNIKIWAFDDDGISSVFKDTNITVLKGAPVINSFTPVEVWVADDTVYTVDAKDPNSTSILTEVSFDSGTTWKTATGGKISHKFGTSSAGLKKIRVRVTDSDMISTYGVYDVKVRLGRPEIKGGVNYGDSRIKWFKGKVDDPDTMVYVWNVEQAFSFIAIDTSDTNGQCKKYFWDWESYSDTTTFIPILKKSIFPHTNNRVTVTAKDDDSLISEPFRFVVFPDELPSPINTTTDKAGDSVMIFWKGMDSFDSTSTQYRIIMKQGSEPDSTDVIQDFKAGNEYQSSKNEDYKFMWVFKGGQKAKTYYYRVIARDRHGNIAPESSYDKGSFIAP